MNAENDSFTFDGIFMKLIGNWGRRKVSDQFHIRPDLTDNIGFVTPSR